MCERIYEHIITSVAAVVNNLFIKSFIIKANVSFKTCAVTYTYSSLLIIDHKRHRISYAKCFADAIEVMKGEVSTGKLAVQGGRTDTHLFGELQDVSILLYHDYFQTFGNR